MASKTVPERVGPGRNSGPAPVGVHTLTSGGLQIDQDGVARAPLGEKLAPRTGSPAAVYTAWMSTPYPSRDPRSARAGSRGRQPAGPRRNGHRSGRHTHHHRTRQDHNERSAQSPLSHLRAHYADVASDASVPDPAHGRN